MKLTLIILFVILTHLNTFGEEGKVYVHALEPGLDLTSIKSKEIETVQGIGKSKSYTKTLPSPSEMEELFKKSDLEKETRGMDQLDRDLFYAKVKERELERVVKNYPKIDKEKIKKLKTLISGSKL